MATGGFFAALPFLLAGAANLAGGWYTDPPRSHARPAPRTLHARVAVVCHLRGATACVDPWRRLQFSRRCCWPLACLASADFAPERLLGGVPLDVGATHAGVVTGFMNTSGNLGA
jgi:hypothetical protein